MKEYLESISFQAYNTCINSFSPIPILDQNDKLYNEKSAKISLVFIPCFSFLQFNHRQVYAAKKKKKARHCNSCSECIKQIITTTTKI